MKPEGVVVWGGTGLAEVAQSIFGPLGAHVACVCDRNVNLVSPFSEAPAFHRESDFLGWLGGMDAGRLSFVAAIGGVYGSDRLAVHRYLSELGLSPLSLVHPTAFVDGSAALGDGAFVAAMSAVSVGVIAGRQFMMLTNASIDHHSKVGDGVHLMPGATVAGSVDIGSRASIGTNATVMPWLRIGVGATVGAGAVVTHDVADGETVMGVPARPVTSNPVSTLAESDNPWTIPTRSEP